MTERIWLNGRVIPMSEARISVEDRGFQFADGVYEVIRLYAGRPFALDAHLKRLERSAEGIELELPLTRHQLADEIEKFDVGNAEGMIYLQVTRGVSPRNHLFPELCGQKPVPPTMLFYFRPLPALPAIDSVPGVKLQTAVDERWQRCWIKSIALLPNVLAKNAAVIAGADEAVYIDNGIVTECSASNFFAVINGAIVTHPVGKKVLPGVTRDVMLNLARDLGIPVQERTLTETEALQADELWIASTTREISWVSHWNGKPIKPGHLGPVGRRLLDALKQHVADQCALNSTPAMASA